MKILLTATVQSHICQFHRPLVEMLHAYGCEVHVAARDNLAEKGGMKLDFADKVFNIPFARSPKSPQNLHAYRQLKKIIDEGHYDVVHCNAPMGGIVTRLAARDVRKRGTKVYYTAHGFHFYQGAPKKNWLFIYPVEKFFAKNFTDKLITITAEDYALARKKFRCPVARIHGVGVDERRYFPVNEAEKQRLRAEMGFVAEDKLLLIIGELLPNKNQKMAIDMMAQLVKTYPRAKLLIAGNGPEQEHLEAQIKELGLENNIQLLGYKTNLQDYQHIADVCVACSKREGLPLNIVESMLSGTPVVATHNRGHRELIEDGRTGYLVQVDNVDGMRNAVVELLGDEAQYARIALAAREYAQSYCASEVKSELEKIYLG